MLIPIQALVLLIFSFILQVTYAATPFNGLYLGANLGLNNADIKDSVDYAANIPPISFAFGRKEAVHVNNRSGESALFIGVSKSFKHLYLAIEGRASVPLSSFTVQYNAQAQELDSGLDVQLHSAVQLREAFAAIFNLGVVLNLNTLIYGKIGPVWSNFDISSVAIYDHTNLSPGVSISTTAFGHQDSYKLGVLYGLGISYSFTDRCSFGLEYSYSSYGQLHFPAAINGTIVTVGFPPDGSTVRLKETFAARLKLWP